MRETFKRSIHPPPLLNFDTIEPNIVGLKQEGGEFCIQMF